MFLGMGEIIDEYTQPTSPYKKTVSKYIEAYTICFSNIYKKLIPIKKVAANIAVFFKILLDIESCVLISPYIHFIFDTGDSNIKYEIF